ncbi:MAG: threonine/serine ThrE exporter family protein [Nocardioidaceae bacterium]
MPDSRETYLTLDLALRVGEVLLSSGAGAADVTATMLSITHACGLRNCEVDVTFTSLALSYQPGPDQPSHSQMRSVRHRAIDYSRLTDVDLMVRGLLSGEIDRDEARTRLASIVSAGHRYPWIATTIGWGFMGMGASITIGGDWIVTLIAFVAAVGVDRIMRALERQRLPSFYQQVAGGLFATLLAVGVASTQIRVDPSLVVTASIIMLLSGVASMGAVQDALTGYYVTSAARALEAMLLTAGIIAGVSGGIAIANKAVVGVAYSSVAGGLSVLPLLLFGAGLTAGAFAFALHAPVRALVPIALVAVLGELAFKLVLLQDFGRTYGSAAAAIVIGVVSYAVAGRVRVPPLVVVVSSVVPLLPGLSIYRGLFQVIDGQTHGLISLVTAGAIAVAIASGVILGEYVAQPLKREARRLEARLAGPRLVGPFRARQPKRDRDRDRNRG